MNEQISGGPEEGKGGAGQAPGTNQPESGMEPHKGPEEPGKGRQWCWEAQLQQFLKTLQAPHSAWMSPQLSEAAPWDDAKAFLASFEQVAAACGWPRGEWVARLRPALSGEALQAFGLLAARDQEDYGKVKAAILRSEALRREVQRQHFRQFCCPQELGDPRRMYSQVQELCCQWLRPETHTKEQILELLVLEQFLASLPVEVQSWVRAGGPDSCAQAVALLEEFLMSQRGADTGTYQSISKIANQTQNLEWGVGTTCWSTAKLGEKELQEPLQEWAVGPLDEVQGQSSREHAEPFRDTQQDIKEEVTLPGLGIQCPTSVLPSKDPDMDEDEMSKALAVQVEQGMIQRKMEMPFHVVKTPMQSSQCTTFWKVLQEEDENVDSLEESLGPQHGCAPHPVKKEEMFLLDTVPSQRLPGQNSGDGEGSQLKMENSLLGGNEPVDTPRRGQWRTPENVLMTAEVQEEGCESNREQKTEPLRGSRESGELPQGLRAACSNPSSVGGKASSSTYGRWYRRKSGPVFEHTGEECNEGSLLGGKIQLESKLDKHQSSHREEKNHDCPELGVRLPSHSLAKHQIIHGGEKTCKCPDCGKSFSGRANLLKHQNIHSGHKPHKCPDCGKSFHRRSHLLRHQSTHSVEKPHKCSDCGRSFSRRSNVLIHQNIHTGLKTHKCPVCGKSFSQRSNLLMHQNIHTGHKPHKCPDCGKSFHRKSHLLSHQSTHSDEKPHKCSDCGRNFSRRSSLLRHRKMHTS